MTMRMLIVLPSRHTNHHHHLHRHLQDGVYGDFARAPPQARGVDDYVARQQLARELKAQAIACMHAFPNSVHRTHSHTF
eukprot:6191050-Pleurochrysis_carterae.AAC.2